jgi:hypothetical protein
MDADEQEYGSIRYIAARLTIVQLSSGRIAIGEGFNPPDLLHICEDWNDAAEWLEGYTAAHLAEGEARHSQRERARRAQAIPEITLDLNLDNLELNL